MKKAIVFLADGFEECEGLIVVDLLRRAGITVETASVMSHKEVLSAHNIKICADVLADNADYDHSDIIVLPGGIPGTYHLRDSEIVCSACRKFAADKLVAAICAAPSVLAGLGLLTGKNATCYPSFESKLEDAKITHGKVEVAENIITGQALGAAIPFALQIIKTLEGNDTAKKIADSICYSDPFIMC